MFFSHLALSFDKIGCGSGKKIEQALFFPLTLHYLCKYERETIQLAQEG
mgnify:CR=1 FL=1